VTVISALNSEAFAVFGQRVIWSDMVGNSLGLAALALGWRRSMLTWPAQLLSGLVLIAAYASAHLGGGVGKQLVVIVVAGWGWSQWQRGRPAGGAVTVTFATWTQRGRLVAGTAVGTLAVGGIFTAFPSLSWSPWADAYIFVGTLAAMFAQARGWVEFWFAWLAVDVVGVPLAFNSGLPFSGLVYIVYFVLVIVGMYAWWMQTRTPQPQVGTAIEGASA